MWAAHPTWWAVVVTETGGICDNPRMYGNASEDFHEVMRDARPDHADPATRGCMLELVREAWGCPGAHCDYSRSITVGDSPWWVWVLGEHERWMCVARAPTEGDALAAALLAAPVSP